MFIYGIFSTILFLFSLPFYYFVRVLNGKFLYGWREKMAFYESPQLGEKVIMLHGVSVGEVIALENLIKKIKEQFPDHKIVITTGTRTGQEIAQKKFADVADFITYFPFDIPFCVRNFLSHIKPSVVLIAETELWPTFAFYCKRRKIPLYIINGRISDSTYKVYKFMKPFFAQVLKNYSGIFTQSEQDKNKLINIGAPESKTNVMKNLKFDINKSDTIIEIGKSNNRIIIAGSTHKGEDKIIIKIFSSLKKQFPDIKLLLAPRHMSRFSQIKTLIKETELSYGYRSEKASFQEKDIIILDTMGELSKMYSIGDFAFIGGSFNKTGGHNPLETIVYNKPAITGPNIHNFRDIYWILGRTSAGKIVKTPKELNDYMYKLLNDKEFYNKACLDCKTVFEDQQGALDFVINQLSILLK